MSSTEVANVPAQELSPEEKQAAAEAAFVLSERVVEGMAAGRQALWIVASALYEFEETAGWLALGFEKKSDWLAQPEIGITQRTYNRYVHAWRTLVVQRQLPPADLQGLEMSKVDIVLPKVETGEVKLEQAMDDVRTMAQRDLRVTYMRPKLGRPKVEKPEPGAPDPATAAAEDAPEPGADASTPEAPADEPGTATDATPEPEPETPEEPAEEVHDAELVVDEAAAMRMYDTRLAAEDATQEWAKNPTTRSGAKMYEVLIAFLELTA